MEVGRTITSLIQHSTYINMTQDSSTLPPLLTYVELIPAQEPKHFPPLQISRGHRIRDWQSSFWNLLYQFRLSPLLFLCLEPVKSTFLINSKVNNCTSSTSKSQTHPQAPQMPQTCVLFQHLYLKIIMMITYSKWQIHPPDLWF